VPFGSVAPGMMSSLIMMPYLLLSNGFLLLPVDICHMNERIPIFILKISPVRRQ
jgi:hypothetical protein